MRLLPALLPFLVGCAATTRDSVSIEEEQRRYSAEARELAARGASGEEALAHERSWAARFAAFARCGDPAVEDAAYEAWGLVLSNMRLEEPNPEALALFREWAERYPDSQRLGSSLWMLVNATWDDAEPLLREFAGSDSETLARGALFCLAHSGFAENPAPLFEEVVARWPGSREAEIAARSLRNLALTPGAPAPGFSLPSTNGGTVDLSSLRGKVVLLVFFGFW